MNTNPKENYKFIHHALLRATDTALHLLQKAADLTKEKNIKEEELLAEKLAPDMFDLKKQFQVFADNAVGGVARPAGIEKPSMPDTETTIAELITKMEKSREFILSIDPEKVGDMENIKIKLGWMPEGMYLESHAYLGDYVLQNTLFHLVTAYGILRHKGANIGKQDFMGRLEFKQENK